MLGEKFKNESSSETENSGRKKKYILYFIQTHGEFIIDKKTSNINSYSIETTFFGEKKKTVYIHIKLKLVWYWTLQVGKSITNHNRIDLFVYFVRYAY